MGLVLGTCCAAQMACCVGSTVCSCCCGCLPAIKASTSTRLMYLAMLSLIALLSMVFLSGPFEDWLQKLSFYYDFCKEQQVAEGSICKRVLGYSAVYHICFGGFLFFALLALLMVCAKSSADPRVKFDRGFWLWKFIMLIGAIVAVFFIPTNTAFTTTMYVIGLIGGFVFICVQILMLIDFGHSWNEAWVGRMEDSDNKGWFILLMFCTCLMFGGAFIGVVLMFIYYSGSGCHDNTFVLCLLLVLSLVISVLSILPKVQDANPKSGLLQASLTSLFVVCITWMAFSSDPREQCNASDDTEQWVIIALALFLADFTILVASGSSRSSDSATNYASDEGDRTGGQAVVDDEEDEVSYSHSLFHVAMATACLFVMMTLTQWDSPMDIDANTTKIDLQHSKASKWVKISSTWVCFVAYVWVLFAPMIFPDRDFN